MADLKELGTLIVVVGKARNLPNLARFGKQDPFCSITVRYEKHKTKPIKRGGQHPEWDEEMRFTIYEDNDDILAASAAEAAADTVRRKSDTLPPLPNEQVGVVTPATMASKSRVAKTGKKVGKTMKVACYADDPKEPELIGEAIVSIEEVLQKGEVDDWYMLKKKDKECGEIYLECTFFSNKAPPVKRDVARPTVYNPNAPIRPQTQSAATGMNLYIPPYGQPGPQSAPSVGGVGVVPGRPPPVQAGAHGAAAAAAAGRLHSQSFSELGLPPQRPGFSAPTPGQPDYPPGGRPGPVTHGSVDALTRPMMSMSLGPSYRPNGHPDQMAPQPPPQPQHGTVHGHGNHRHSLDHNGVAPWLQQQQSQQQQQHPATPQRPVSAAEMGYGGMHNDPRMNGVQSVSPSPMGQPPHSATPPHHGRTNSTSLVVPGGAPMPMPQQQSPHSSVSTPGAQMQAPYTPPHNRRHSSYGPNYQATPPQPTPPQPAYGQPPSQPSYGQPPAQDSYPPVPPAPQKQPSYGPGSPYDPHRQRTDSFGSTPVPGGYPPNQSYPPAPSQTPAPYRPQSSQTPSPYPPQSSQTPSPYPPHSSQTPAPYPPQSSQTPAPYPPQSSQTPAPYGSPQVSGAQPPSSPPSTSTGSYVPWYMQTPQNQNTSTPPPASNYSNPPAPPPPAPPARVGYYPSDELYAMQAKPQASPSTGPPAPYPPQNSQPSPPHNNGYNQAPPTPTQQQPQQQQQPFSPQQHQQYPPAPPAPYPPINNNPNSTANNSGYASTPPPPPRPTDNAPWAHLQQQSYTSSPPSQSHTLYYAQQGTGSDFRPGTAAPDWNSGTTSAPPVPAPLPPSGGGTTSNRDWRSYLSSLSSNPAEGTPPPVPPPPPQRNASPNPPPRPYSTNNNAGYTPPVPPPPSQSQHQQHQQQQQDWYNTPPPPVPNSIIPDYRPPTQPQWR